MRVSKADLQREFKERKKAEATLRAQEEKFRIVADFTYDWEYWRGLDNGFIYVSPSCERITGYTVEDFMRDPGLYPSIIHPDDRGIATDHFADQLSREPCELEFRITRRDGQEIWIHHVCQAVVGQNREYLGRRASNRDITERKRAEEDLRQIQDRLKRSQEIAHLGSWELDLVTNRLYWSDEVYRIFGLEPQEFGATYEAFLEAVHPDDRQAVDAAYSGSIREGKDSYEIEHRVIRKSTGEIRYVHEKGQHIRDEKGKIALSVGMVHDVTERKKAEAEIAHLASFPELNPNPVIELDDSGNVTYANPTTRKLFPDLATPGNAHPFLALARDHILKEPKQSANIDVSIGTRWYVQTLAYISSRQSYRIYARDITERKRFEEEMKKTNEMLEDRVRRRSEEVFGERQRLYSVLETLPAYVVLLDKDYHVPFANRFFCERFGESHGKRCYEYLFKRNEPCENCESYKVMQTRAPHHWEWRGPDVRDYDIFDYPFNDTDGSLMILEMGIDITERKKAEAALNLASAYNRSLIEASLDPLVTIGPGGKITDVNASTEAATGLPRDEIIGTDFSDYFTSPEMARAGYQQVFREGSVRDYPLELRHRDGHVTPVLYNASVYRNEQGEVIGVFAAARDITERKRAEAALKELNETLEKRVAERTAALSESEERFRVIAETSPVYIAVTRASDGVILFINPAYSQAFGYQVAELVGRKGVDLYADLSERAALTEKLTGQGFVKDYEIRFKRADSTIFWVSLSAQTINYGGEQAFLAASVDITERKRAEEELKRINAELEASNKELEAFSYSVSHDLRAPLRSMEGFSAALLEDYAAKIDDQGKQYLRYVQESSDLMARLIDDLLKLSRVTRSDMSYEIVDMSGLAHEITAKLIKAEPQRKVQLNLEPGIYAYGDGNLLRLVLENLLGNAWKFTGKTGSAVIEMGVTEHSGKRAYFVRDNGVGFDMNYAGKLFQPFQRLHKSTDFAGTGIGLATVQRIVRRHGGEVWAEGKVGQGATFYFTLTR